MSGLHSQFTDDEMRGAFRAIEYAAVPCFGMDEMMRRLRDKPLPLDHETTQFVLSQLRMPSCLREQPCGSRRVCRHCEQFFYIWTPAGRAEQQTPGTLAALRRSVAG